MKLFENRDLLIVTKHGKDKVLQPLLENNLNVRCKVSLDFDTDSFGTFSGEIKRTGDALTTLRKKCHTAMMLYNADLAVASEGSFGPHPTAFFASADDEMVILLDLKNKLEIIGRKISMETNFASQECSDLQALQEFLKSVNFPSHKVILKSGEKDDSTIYKDCGTLAEVKNVFEILISKYGKVHVETDMRAMNNPKRMKVISQAAENLIEKINLLCPKCQMPGFSVSAVTPGLRCGDCHLPTKSILYNTSTCQKCHYTEQKYYPRGISFENPMYCDNCNP